MKLDPRSSTAQSRVAVEGFIARHALSGLRCALFAANVWPCRGIPLPLRRPTLLLPHCNPTWTVTCSRAQATLGSNWRARAQPRCGHGYMGTSQVKSP